MRFKDLLLLLLVLACFAIMAYAAPPKVVQPADAPLDLSAGNMQIVSTEHTAEYLAMTGGMAQPGSEGSYRNVAGNWTFELRDQRSRPMGDIDLQLFQSGGVIFGKGVFREGLRQQPVTADGALVDGNTMTLNVVSLENVNLYRLSINSADGNTTSGTFSLFAPSGGEPVKGSISGGKNEARRLS